MDDFKVKNQVFDAKRSYKEILKNSDDIKQIAKNTGLDTEDVKKVKDYLFKEKHLMPDGTYRQFDASEEIADAWKRLTNGKATDEDLLLFNHELKELGFAEKGLPTDLAHFLASAEFDCSSMDELAEICGEIYHRDFYFGAGSSNISSDALKRLREMDEYKLYMMEINDHADEFVEAWRKANLDTTGGMDAGRKEFYDRLLNSETVAEMQHRFYEVSNAIGLRTDLSDIEKIEMLKGLFTQSDIMGFSKDLNVVCDTKFIKGFDSKTGRVIIDWPEKMGFDMSRTNPAELPRPISRDNPCTGRFDRYGSMSGNNFSDIPLEGRYIFESRSLPYIQNENAYHLAGEFDPVSYFDKIDAIRNGDIDALNNILESEGFEKITDKAFEEYVKQYCDYENDVAKAFGGTMYNAPYGISGYAAPWRDLSGGATQYTFPLSGKSMMELGIMS